jgi:hypothetical protein
MADILMITAIAGADNCAGVLSRQFQLEVEIASSRKEAVALLKRCAYRLMIVDESMIEAGEDGSDTLFRHCGAALPLEVNFAISGSGRLIRAVRAALVRLDVEREAAMRSAATVVQSELREIIAGLLLNAELAAKEPDVPMVAAGRLRTIVELAELLRQRLDVSPLARRGTPAASIGIPSRTLPVAITASVSDGASHRRKIRAAKAVYAPRQPMA